MIQKTLIAATLLGLMCGVLGTFVVVRRISLVGDTVSHSILPGIVLGFVVSTAVDMNRNPWIILGCATLIGLLSMVCVRQILASTRLKSDAALGIVLSGFFGIGLFMKRSLADYMSSSGGLEGFLFGNLATVSDEDLFSIFVVGIALVVAMSLLMRPFMLVSFDSLFAVTLGYPVKLLNLIFYALLTVTIVVSVQAVGVVLVSSMLVIPASAAFLLTDRKNRMMWLSMAFGALAGLGGCLTSIAITSRNVPNGATMTLIAAAVFTLCYLGAPKHGILAKRIRRKRLESSVRNENALKAIYKKIEDLPSQTDPISLQEFAGMLRENLTHARQMLTNLSKAKYITTLTEDSFRLTDSGLNRAMQIVRNHRLWELYLTKQADYQTDHVHDDAELIEHVLDEETVQQLEAELGFPTTDPHGKPIPKPLNI